MFFTGGNNVLDKLRDSLIKLRKIQFEAILHKYGKLGVSKLSSETPKDSGDTASSWRYELKSTEEGMYTLGWYNDASTGQVPIVLLLQYGHGTGTGGYVPGFDFINPVIKEMVKELIDELELEVTR